MFDADEDDDTVYLSIPSVSASSYSLGYNFKIPLPPFKDFWPWRSEGGEEGEEEGPSDEDKPLESEQEGGPILSINANVGGKLQHPRQRVKLENEETGEMESTEVTTLPSAL